MTSPASHRVAVLIVGDLFVPEMTSVQQRVESLARDGAEIRLARTVAELFANRVAESWQPQLVIICQRWPEEYAATDLRQLLAAFPLARLVCCYGPWCGSDGRTRDVWPLSIRVPAEEAARRIDLELEVLAGARSPLPLTASRDETFLFDAAR